MVLKNIFAALLCAIFLCSCVSVREYRYNTIRAQHPEWDEETLRNLAARNVKPGMTREMVVAALGKPESVSREGNEEVWGYAYNQLVGENYRRVFVYFVHLKGDTVVSTRGDTTHLQTYYL